jgi:tetratricopeptide (TPR) repeat protein
MINEKTYNFHFYQSANITDYNVIKQNFIVRNKEFELLRSDLVDDRMDDTVQHFLILGRRGSGKSTLLKRIEYEIRNDDFLKQKYTVINFAEEQGGIHRLFDLLEEIIRVMKCLGYENLPNTDSIDIPDDFSEYARNLHSHIRSALKTQSKKLVLLIDNIDRIFLGIEEDARILREILLNYDDIKIIGASTRMSEHFWQYDLPFYQFFRIIKLEALSAAEIQQLLLAWSDIFGLKEIEDFIKTKPGQLEAIRILTDGLPRTLQFFIDLLINRPQQNGYAYIQKIMDIMTPLYQERLTSMVAIEQKIVMKLAFAWEAVSIRELVKPTKIESKLLSANLKKLSDLGIVDIVHSGKKNHLYRLSERFFNMWLIVTQGNPIEKQKARWLTIFLENWYNSQEIRQIVAEHLENLKTGKLSPDHLTMMTKALAQSRYTSFLEREALIKINLALNSMDETLKSSLPSTSSDILSSIRNLITHRKFEEALVEAENIPNEIDGIKDGLKGSLYQVMNESKKAEKYLKTAVKKGDVFSYLPLAQLYFEIGEYELAEKNYLYAIEKGVNDVLDKLGNLYFIMEKYDLAEKYFIEAIKNGKDDAKNDLAKLYLIQGKYNDSENLLLYLIKQGNKEAAYNLTIQHYFFQPKNKEVIKKYLKKWRNIKDIKVQRFYLLLQLWFGEIQGVQKEVFEIAKTKDGIDETFILHLLIHYQKNLVWQLFNDPEVGTELKEKFSPLYYSTALLVDDEASKLVRLKIPPEINGTVQEVLKEIERQRKEYYPNTEK